MKTYRVPGARLNDWQHPAPERTAYRACLGLNFDYECKVWPSRGAMLAAQPEGLDIVAVELNHDLAIKLSADGLAGFVEAGDFLKCNGDLGTFDRIVMNPPFQGGADIRHIQHAATMLRPGGRLVALCADGPRQRKAFETVSDSYSSLPPGSFKDQGTGVNVAMVVLTNEA